MTVPLHVFTYVDVRYILIRQVTRQLVNCFLAHVQTTYVLGATTVPTETAMHLRLRYLVYVCYARYAR